MSPRISWSSSSTFRFADQLSNLVHHLLALAGSHHCQGGLKPLAPTQIDRELKFVALACHQEGDGIEPDAALLKRAVVIYERQYLAVLTRDLRTFPGVEEGLRRLRAAGFKLACVTNKASRFTLPLLSASGLRHYFDLVVSGDTAARPKPDPAPLLYAVDQFGIQPHDLLLIGDSINDFDAARAAGCPVFLVPYGYNEGRDATDLAADAIVPGLVEAAELIENSAA